MKTHTLLAITIMSVPLVGCTQGSLSPVDLGIEIVSVERCEDRDGYTYGIGARIHNNGDGQVTLQASDFELSDSDGAVWTADSYNSKLEAERVKSAGTVNAGLVYHTGLEEPPFTVSHASMDTGSAVDGFEDRGRC